MLVDFLVPVAWPLVALTVLFVLRKQLAAGVSVIAQAVADFISSRLETVSIGIAKVEALPPAPVTERVIKDDQPPKP